MRNDECGSESAILRFFLIRVPSCSFVGKSFLIGATMVFALSLLGGCDDMTPATAVRLMHDPVSPDARRTGIAALVTRWSFGKRPPYPGYYAAIARNDREDYTVRAMAIRALNICRDASATPIFIAGLKDENELVRLESAKALANLPDPAAVPALIDVLYGRRVVSTPNGEDEIVFESRDVRIAAADALRQYRTPEVARTLISYLNETDFGVAWQSRQSLIAMTGRDLKYDESSWLQYLAGQSKPFG